MSNEKPFRKINELVEALSGACQELSAGTLQPDGLELACDDARDLYERFVVLRHKAREAMPTPKAQTGAANKLREPASTPRVAEEPLRLDTRPAPDPPSRQTSLIDAIASTEEDQTTVVAPATTIAEKLEKAAVDDLGKAISLSQKFWFVAELFNGDRIAYDKAMDRLNTATSVTDAMSYAQQEVIDKLKKPADPEAVSTFTDLVQRRYA